MSDITNALDFVNFARKKTDSLKRLLNQLTIVEKRTLHSKRVVTQSEYDQLTRIIEHMPIDIQTLEDIANAPDFDPLCQYYNNLVDSILNLQIETADRIDQLFCGE